MMAQIRITLERTLGASPEKVFEAWLNTALLEKWMFGPAVRDEKIISLQTDAVAGGRFSFTVQRNGTNINHVGKYLVIAPPHKLSFTWGIEGQSVDQSIVTIEISPVEQGCHLILTHELDEAWKEYAERTKAGWNFMLDKMEENYLFVPKQVYVTAQMLIRKPVAQVFHAFIDPDITRHFWFTKGSGQLEAGKHIQWDWEMYHVTTAVFVKEIIPEQKIAIEWGTPATAVDFEFQALNEAATYVTIRNYGLKETGEKLLSMVNDLTGGFTTVLDGLKAFLEYGIELNLIADKFPKELVHHGK